MAEDISLDEDDTEMNDFYIYDIDKRKNLDNNIHDAVYDIMIEFKIYVEDVSLPLIENLNYLYLFDYIDSLKS